MDPKGNSMMEVEMKTIIVIIVLAILTGCAVVPAVPMHSRAYYVHSAPPPPPAYVYHRPQYPAHGERGYTTGYEYHR